MSFRVSCFTQKSAVVPSRNLAGNPDSPQAVIFLTSITDVMMGYRNVLRTLSRPIRL